MRRNDFSTKKSSSTNIIGLTSSASLWASACMGLAIGVGFYSGAIIAFIYIFLTTAIFHKLDRLLYKKTKIIMLYVELKPEKSIASFISELEKDGLSISEIDINKQDEFISIGFTINCAKSPLL